MEFRVYKQRFLKIIILFFGSVALILAHKVGLNKALYVYNLLYSICVTWVSKQSPVVGIAYSIFNSKQRQKKQCVKPKRCKKRKRCGCSLEMWWLIGSAPDYWGSDPGSNSASLTVAKTLRTGRVTVYTVKSRGREGNLPLRPKKEGQKKLR